MAVGKYIRISRHTFEPKHFLRSEVLDGDTKGTIIEITLDPEGEEEGVDAASHDNTKVSVNADLKLGKIGSVVGVFAKRKIKGGLEHMIEEFENVMNKTN